MSEDNKFIKIVDELITAEITAYDKFITNLDRLGNEQHDQLGKLGFMNIQKAGMMLRLEVCEKHKTTIENSPAGISFDMLQARYTDLNNRINRIYIALGNSEDVNIRETIKALKKVDIAK